MGFSRETVLPGLILSAVLAVNTAALWPELSISRVDLNDNVMHFALVERMVHAVQNGENPIDFWSPEWSLGYPVLRTYQPLAHGLVALAFFLLGKSVSLMTVFVWVRFLSLALLPLTFYVSARRMGLDRWTALAAGTLAPLVSTNFLYGIEYTSYVWAGSGLFTQAVAVHFLLLALGMAFQAIRQGRRQALAGALLGLTSLCHLVYGCIGALSVCLLAVIPDSEPRAARLRRAIHVGAVALVLGSFQILPLLLDRARINHSRWEPVWKWDSFGPGQVLRWLFSGELLDFNRLPVLTLLAFSGAGLWWWRRRARTELPAHSFAICAAALWLAVFLGRSVWGPVLALVGFPADSHLHRVIGGAQIFLVLLAAIALAAGWRELARRRQYAIALAATVILLYPMVKDRAQYLANNAQWGRRNLAAYEAAKAPIEATIAAASARGGRAYAGLAGTWGGKFKIGDAPVYAFFGTHQVPAVSFLYHSMALTGDIMVRFNDWNPAQYRLFNIRTVVWPGDSTAAVPAFLTPAGQNGNLRIFEAPGTGYFDVVDAAAAVRTSRTNFYDLNDRWLQSDGPALRQHLLLDWRGEAPGGLARVPPDRPLPPFIAMPAPGAIKSERQDGEIYGATVEVARPSYLLFRMTWHPNWRVEIDGAAQPTFMLSPGFVGVSVTPGTHRVVCRYAPEQWKSGLAVLGLLLTLLLVAAEAGWIPVRLAVPRWGRLIPAGLEARRRTAIAAGLVALSLPVCLPLFTGEVLFGHDAFCYFPRLVEVHQNVIHGILLPRWAPDLGRGSGQPLFLFHPPFFYWVAETWHLLGFDVITAVNLACAGLVLASATAMFLLARLYFGSLGGWLGAAAYVYAPYFAVDLFVRSALEEFAAFALFPLALFGFGAYARRRQPRYLLLGSVSYALILFCHFPAALLFSPLLGSFLIFSACTVRSWTVFRDQACALLLGMGAAACVWVPALAESHDVALERAVQGYARYSNHLVYLHQLILSPWGYGLSGPGPNDGLSFSVGWGHLVLLTAAGAAVTKWGRPWDRIVIRFFGAAGAILCLMMLQDAIWFWDHLPLLQYVELPWRLLGPVAVCGAMLAAAAGPAISLLRRWRRAAIAGAFALLIVPNLAHLAPRQLQPVDLSFWTPAQLATTGFETTTMGELTPRWMRSLPPYAADAGRWKAGGGGIRENTRTPFFWSADLTAAPGSTLRLSTAWYPGWTVRIDGLPAATHPDSETGQIEFPVPEGRHQVTLAWESTGIRRTAFILSLLSLLALAAAAHFWSTGPSSERRVPVLDQVNSS